MGMGGAQVDERPAAVVSQRFGVGFQARCLGFEERARVLEQNVAAVQVALERSLGKQRVEMALENQASSDRAGYRIPVQITENGHVDLARVRWFTSSEVGAAISLKSIWRGWDRCHLWLWPQAALGLLSTSTFIRPRIVHDGGVLPKGTVAFHVRVRTGPEITYCHRAH